MGNDPASTGPDLAAGPAFKRVWALLLGALTLGVATGLSTLGMDPGVPPLAGPASLLFVLGTSGVLAGAYLVGGVGWGLLLLGLIRPRNRAGAKPSGSGLASAGHADGWIALALGPGLLLWISHLLGVAGLLSAKRGVLAPALAWGVCLVGVAVVMARVVGWLKARPRVGAPPLSAALWVVPVAVLLLGACNPPGALWGSEASGFDALSYHLTLPQEWWLGERLWPLKHNVYSFLPSGMEAGFLHLAAMNDLGGAASGSTGAGLLAADGRGALACQLLHAGVVLLSGLVVARVVAVTLERFGASRLPSRVCIEAGAVGGAAAVATPWMLVVGSLAYNEGGVNLLAGGALLASLDARRGPACRAVLAGLMLGLAVFCKPTAAFLVGPMVGVFLLGLTPWRAWWRVGIAGGLAGVLAVAPFLIRNALASGNPVFPALTGVFGAGHWSVEQVERFKAAHTETLPLAGRVGLLLARQGDGLPVATAGPNVPPAARPGPEPRGVFHTQWSVLFPVGVACLVVVLTGTRRRADPEAGEAGGGRGLAIPGAWLAAGLVAGTLWWLGFSHCQSRFLTPLVVPLAALVGLAFGRAAALFPDGERAPARRGLMLVCAVVPAALGVQGMVLFLSQVRAAEAVTLPNAFLAEGTEFWTGARLRAQRTANPEGVEAVLNTPGIAPSAFVNVTVPPDEAVLLVGDSTPFYFTGTVRWATTYDKSPLVELIRRYPDDPDQWTRELLGSGVRWVLVNPNELARLARSGFADPALSPDALRAWVERLVDAGGLVRAFDSGQVLLRLRIRESRRPDEA
jgi:hypothetical protein